MTNGDRSGITGIAQTTVEGLKSNPSCLAAIALAAIFAVLTFYAMQRDADRRAQTVNTLLTRCMPQVGKTSL
jgi:hypothetical protein